MAFAGIKRRKAAIPAFDIPKVVMDDLGALASAGIVGNVLGRRQASGEPIKRNSPGWTKYKWKMGWLSSGITKSLIAEKHRFVKGRGQSWEWVVKGSTVIIRPATEDLKKLTKWLQQMGYVGWFAVSGRTALAMRRRVRKWMASEFAWARGRARMIAESRGTTAPRPEWEIK